MRELFQVWGNTRMVVLTAICAAAYVAILVPFKAFTLIPGFTEIRPAAAIPVALSFLFGPAAAWGSAFGNLIGDVLGGTLGPGDLPGFAGNFLYGYLPYAVWRAFMGHAHPLASGVKGWIAYALAVATACLACGSVIGWGVDLMGLVPFAALGVIIVVNNLIVSAAIASVLVALLYGRVRDWGLLYFQIMEEERDEPPEETSPPGPSEGAKTAGRFAGARNVARFGAVLCIAGALAAFFAGLAISGGLHTGFGATAFAGGAKGTTTLAAGMAPGLTMMLIGAALL